MSEIARYDNLATTGGSVASSSKDGIYTVTPSGSKMVCTKQIEVSAATNQLVLSDATFNVSSSVVNLNLPLTVVGAIVGTAWTGTGQILTTLTTAQMLLRYDASNTATFTVSSAGVLTVAPSGTKITTAKQIESSVSTNQLVLNGTTFSSDGTVITCDKIISAQVLTTARARTVVSAATYTILAATDNIIGVAYSSTGVVTLTVPLASTCTAGRQFIIIDEGGLSATNPITLARSGADLINGAASVSLATNYGHRRLFSNGVAAWYASVA